MTILFAILLFSVLIFVHELGHFVAAKLSGIQVNEFSMFMGPAIFKKQVGDTLYSLRCIPIGGYCAMEGEDEDTDNPRSFQKAAWWKRLIVLVAGAAMNFLIGVLIYAFLILPVRKIGVPVISDFTDCCLFNTEDGLHLGDEILEVDGEKIYVMGDVGTILSLNKTTHHDITVLRDGEKIVFDDLLMAHTEVDADGNEYLHYGFTYGKPQDIKGLDKVGYVWKLAMDDVRMVRLSLQMLFNGQAKFSDVSGPVGIVSIMSEVAAESETKASALRNMLSMGAFLAINLAVMNLLPIPALDGGRVVGLLITTGVEAVTRKKLNPKYEGYLHAAGMILLLALMAVVMFKDIFTIFKG